MVDYFFLLSWPHDSNRLECRVRNMLQGLVAGCASHIEDKMTRKKRQATFRADDVGKDLREHVVNLVTTKRWDP